MNSVSWFIYASDVVSNLQPTFAISGGAAIIAAGFFTLFTLFAVVEDEGKAFKTARSCVFIGVPLVFLATLIPSKTTMYAIAASQIGETVVTSPEAREMIDDTKAILRDYLKSLKKDAAK